MENKPTGDLDKILEGAGKSDLDRYFKNNVKYMKAGDKTFYYYVKDVLYEKSIRLKDVYKAAGVSETYGSKIVTLEKHTKNRDLIIRLCIAGHFSWDEINRALKLYGMNELYSKDPRDACIIVAVNNRIYDFDEIDRILEKHNFKPLGA